jgi:hypothetical protein
MKATDCFECPKLDTGTLINGVSNIKNWRCCILTCKTPIKDMIYCPKLKISGVLPLGIYNPFKGDNT